MIIIETEELYGTPNIKNITDEQYSTIKAATQTVDYRHISQLHETVWNLKTSNSLKYSICVGSVNFCKEFFCLAKVTDKLGLPRISNRSYISMALGEALKIRETHNKSLFIKPKELKLFTGFVHEGYTYTCLEGIPLDTEVYVYEVFPHPLVSEWRGYVTDHQLIDIRNYSGDPLLYPDNFEINDVIRENQLLYNFPDTYVIDIGITFDSKTNVFTQYVIEFNDMWAIGNYGLPNEVYYQLLKKRFRTLLEDV
jgi:hypothetical protein